MPDGNWRTPLVVLISGTLIVMISLGVRMAYALWLEPATNDLWPGEFKILSLAFALQSLFWGIATPFAGNVSDRFGSGRVVATAGLLYTAGLLLMTVSTTPFMAHLSIGVLTGFAMSGAMFPIILSAISRSVSSRKRDLYLGIATAGGSSGQVVVIPFGQFLVDSQGWIITLYVMAGMTLLIVPLAFALIRPGTASAPPAAARGSLEVIREAIGHRGYMLLTSGYLVCGLQTMFIGTHFPTMLANRDIDPAIGAYALSLIGVFNIAGTLAWGVAGGRFRQKYLLCWLYSLRSLVMTIFILLPITEISVLIFSAALGLLWLGTVPLTGSIVARVFGLRHMGMLFGFSFVAHQFGSFIGIFAAGYFFDQLGNYNFVWWAAIIMGLVASILNYPINDSPADKNLATQPA